VSSWNGSRSGDTLGVSPHARCRWADCQCLENRTVDMSACPRVATADDSGLDPPGLVLPVPTRRHGRRARPEPPAWQSGGRPSTNYTTRTITPNVPDAAAWFEARSRAPANWRVGRRHSSQGYALAFASGHFIDRLDPGEASDYGCPADIVSGCAARTGRRSIGDVREEKPLQSDRRGGIEDATSGSTENEADPQLFQRERHGHGGAAPAETAPRWVTWRLNSVSYCSSPDLTPQSCVSGRVLSSPWNCSRRRRIGGSVSVVSTWRG
jgi:hypothetical protein